MIISIAIFRRIERIDKTRRDLSNKSAKGTKKKFYDSLEKEFPPPPCVISYKLLKDQSVLQPQPSSSAAAATISEPTTTSSDSPLSLIPVSSWKLPGCCCFMGCSCVILELKLRLQDDVYMYRKLKYYVIAGWYNS